MKVIVFERFDFREKWCTFKCDVDNFLAKWCTFKKYALVSWFNDLEFDVFALFEIREFDWLDLTNFVRTKNFEVCEQMSTQFVWLSLFVFQAFISCFFWSLFRDLKYNVIRVWEIINMRIWKIKNARLIKRQ